MSILENYLRSLSTAKFKSERIEAAMAPQLFLKVDHEQFGEMSFWFTIENEAEGIIKVAQPAIRLDAAGNLEQSNAVRALFKFIKKEFPGWFSNTPPDYDFVIAFIGRAVCNRAAGLPFILVCE